jgi:phospholipase C
MAVKTNSGSNSGSASPKNSLGKIKHIVVLMLENRSFDSMLGWLYQDEKQREDQPKFEGLTFNLWNPLDNIDTDGNRFIEKVPVEMNGQKKYKGANEIKNPVDYTLPHPDPGEGFRDTNYQLYGVYDVDAVYPPEPVNIGFVNNYQNAMLYGTYSFGDAPTDPRAIMKCFTAQQTPVLSQLAKSFAVCDQYYCSVPSQTLPNRDFVHAATSTGYVNNKPNADCNAKTIFNQLQDAVDAGRKDLSWAVYSGTSDGKPFSLTRAIMTQLVDQKFDANFKTLANFSKDAAAGKLASYTFIEPQFSGPGQNDQHPPTDIRSGEKLIADIYNGLVKSPQWQETLLVITYDEHGGCYDHVAPPNGAKNPDENNAAGQMGFMFNRFGIRVPAVLVSPYIEAGTIFRSPSWPSFDHTSIIKTVQKCFGLTGYLTQRDLHAQDLGGALVLNEPRKDTPAVKPQPWSSSHDPAAENDLHRTIVAILEKLTGIKKKPQENIHSYIAKAYQTYLQESNKKINQ